MRKYISVSLSIIILLSVALGAFSWARAFDKALKAYRSPLHKIDLPAPARPELPGNQVVVILISGLGYDNSLVLNMPTLNQLRQIGANAAIESAPPTYAQTSWATLITGAPSETNDAPPFDRPPAELHLLEVDTLFARAEAAQRQTALLANAAWGKLLPRNQTAYTLFMDDPSPQGDELIYEAALPIIRDSDYDLIFIHFAQMDFIAQNQGGVDTLAYQHAAGQIDAYLNEIRSAIDLSNTTLIILSDYGHIETGGYGGNEVEVIWQPLVMIGAKIVPGDYSDIHQIDLAPTIATLLGLAPPQATQGRILFEMLRLGEYERAMAQLALARQRVALVEAYARQFGQTIEIELLLNDIAQAQTALNNGNIAGGYQLARLAQEEAQHQMLGLRHSLVQNEQLKRLPLAVLVILLWFTLLWRRRGDHAASIIVAAATTIGLYHGLYQLQGYSYSISSIGDPAIFLSELSRRTAVSMFVGGGILLILLLLTKEERWLILLGTSYGFSVLVTFVFSLPFAWGYWRNGLTPAWYLPDIVPLFWQISSAFEALTAAVAGLLLPWPIMLFNLFVHFIRRRLTTRPSRPEPDALPGLHL